MDRIWTENLIIGILESRGFEVLPEERAAVSRALLSMADAPVPQRTIGRFIERLEANFARYEIATFIAHSPTFSIFDTVKVPESPADAA